jgi:hypothetical protein
MTLVCFLSKNLDHMDKKLNVNEFLKYDWVYV